MDLFYQTRIGLRKNEIVIEQTRVIGMDGEDNTVYLTREMAPWIIEQLQHYAGRLNDIHEHDDDPDEDIEKD